MSSARHTRRPLEGLPTVAKRPAVERPVQPRLRRTSVPKHEPHEASRVTTWDPGAHPPPTQGTLALAMPHDLYPEPANSEQQQPSVGIAVGLLAEPSAWATAFVQAAMEVAGGLRSAGQLIRWTTPEVHGLLVRRGALTSRAQRSSPTGQAKPRLRALVTCTPRPGVCEVSAVIAEAQRIRAVAFRMEGLHGRWRVTELEIG
jgi:hypothetical protein